MKELVSLNDVSVRFRFSYDKVWSIKEKLVEIGKRVLQKKQAKHFTALDGVTLTAGHGEIVGVIGSNGCGKTTLLKTIAGIYSPDNGSVTTHGRVSTLLSLGTGFDGRLNGIENIRLCGLFMGMDHKKIEAMIPEIIAFAEIGEHIYAPMKYYSKGMISRLSFSIVLAIEPEILLIDEIFSVGDLSFKKKSEAAIDRLMKKASCQFLVSHDLEFISSQCTRVLCMENGRIIADGKPQEVVALYRQRADRR